MTISVTGHRERMKTAVFNPKTSLFLLNPLDPEAVLMPEA
jgi:hypothetical protein